MAPVPSRSRRRWLPQAGRYVLLAVGAALVLEGGFLLGEQLAAVWLLTHAR